MRSKVDTLMWVHLKETGETFIEEYLFATPRKWRFDFALVCQKIAIEIEGGAFTRGRHTRGVGFINDMEKYNFAVKMGWKVLRFTPAQVLNGSAIAFIREVLQ